MDAPERAEKIPYSRPRAFGRVDMHFMITIAIFVPCPFKDAMPNGQMPPLEPRITDPLIGVSRGLGAGELLHLGAQRLGIGAKANIQTCR